MLFREAISSDIQSITQLHVESYRSAYRGMLNDDYLDHKSYSDRTALWNSRFSQPMTNQYIAIAEVDKEIVGFACVYGAENPTWGTFLDNLHVAPKHKRKGIGVQLLSHIALWSSQNYSENGLWLWVRELNIPAQKFYLALGAKQVGEEIKGSMPDGIPALVFRYFWKNPKTLIRLDK